MGKEEQGNPELSVSKETADMERVSSALSAPNPSWFTPKRLLTIFCIINLLNYVDRGAMGSNGVNGSPRSCTKSGHCTSGSGIQGVYNLSNFEDGVLSSAFMVGLLVASPVFASLVKIVNPFRLIGVGLTVWTFATAGCGFSFDFWSIAICRMYVYYSDGNIALSHDRKFCLLPSSYVLIRHHGLFRLVGVGEASFISLAAPYIDDNAPVAQKTAWLAIFYTCIPAGVAVGYVYGGLVGDHFSWRFAFFGEAILMAPFAVLGFVMKPLQMKGFSPVESKKALTGAETAVSEAKDDSIGKDGGMLSVKEEPIDQSSKAPSNSKCGCINLDQLSRVLKDLKVLLLDRVYVVTNLGYIAYNFVLGAYSYWGPKAGYSIYHMKNADMMFGGVTLLCGILGTLAGGFVLDKISSTISNAFKLLSVATFLGAAFCFSAFCFKSLYAFLALFTLGQLFIFATQGPVNYICLHCVQPSMRPLSMAMSVVAIHIFGDVPSSPLVGVLQDNINDWRKTALILTSILFLAAIIWFIGIFLHCVDRFNEDCENPVMMVDKSNITPLLDEKTDERANSSART
ncbi:hypothetical protein RHSIM_Rhsim11G0144900 [Rhododendron simsii]|uniref:Major facilitator superfamily (MFS) profile domain-containing protein n=1 Tax=Rhododendron simsii TaxID=118357 RepID=A0A834GBC3_RHOSS|nr:hypothetical protein RHSIM_Rhsim11G0144900 [Rhododendron simsii]